MWCGVGEKLLILGFRGGGMSMAGFVFAVAPSGVCSVVSVRSGRRLSGGALSACLRAVLRRVVRASVRVPVSWLPVPVEPVVSASGAGSRLFLLSSSFRAVLAQGACPVSFLLSVFRWPVRSALLLCLCRVFLSVPDALAVVPRSVRVSFLRSALSSLGFSVSGRVNPKRAVVWLRSRSLLSCPVPEFHGVVQSSALVSALASLSRCLRWLSARSVLGCGCPPALRPAVGLLAGLVARSLWRCQC